MFNKIQMILMMKTSILNSRISRLKNALGISSLYIWWLLFLIETTFPNNSVKYGACYFYWHQEYDEGAFFTLKKENPKNFLYYYQSY